MIKTPVNLQELRRRIYRKAKSEKEHRFWGIFVHLTKIEVLAEAYRQAKRNGGAPGIDGQTFEDVDSAGAAAFLRSIRDDLVAGTYKPRANRFVEIPKGNGKTRTLQIPCIRDRVVQGALKWVLEAIFEADFCPNSYGVTSHIKFFPVVSGLSPRKYDFPPRIKGDAAPDRRTKDAACSPRTLPAPLLSAIKR